MSNTLPRKVQQELVRQGKTFITYVISSDGVDQKVVFDSDDLNTDTKNIANAMAVGSVQEGKNEYQISNDRTTVTLGGGLSGTPAAISDNAPGGDPNKVFLKTNNNEGYAKAREYFNRLSDGGIYNQAPTAPVDSGRSSFDISVIKGKANPGPNDIRYISALEELQSQTAEQANDSTGLALKIGTGLKNNNTYYPSTNNEGNVFLNAESSIPENQSNVGKIRIQTKLGYYERKVGEQALPYKNILIQDDFLNMGLQLPLKATGEIYVPKFGDNQTTDDPAAQIALARASALAPGLARLGLRVPVTDITPTVVLNDQRTGVLINKLDTPTNFPELSVEAINSYGSYNNWIAPFDGTERLLQMPALAIMVGVVGTTVLALAATLQAITGKDTYEDQVRAGFISFFGLTSPLGADRSDPAAFFAALATAIISSRLLNETGWYNTVVRGFIRNVFQEISRGTFAVAATANIANSQQNTGILNRTGVDIYSDGIDGDVVGAAAKIVELFFNSKLIGFCNMLAEIGADSAVKNQQGFKSVITPNKRGIGSTPYSTHGLTANQRSYIDSITDGTATAREGGPPGPNSSGIGNTTALTNAPNLSRLIMKDRLANNLRHGTTMGVKPLSFGAGTTPSMYLLPDTIKKAAVIGGGTTGLAALSAYQELGAMKEIGPDEVKRFENALEASYMPFYIQDMRTNEILSFHAFIENMSDSFVSEYDSETGFGRVEPTHIYKNTRRNMGIKFHVVSTNPDDHDEMWLKINKLVTLIYPQYTKGRALNNKTTGQQFIQPYSQLVGSSPLVRLRVGDVWKSNFSKFNVMRLFGMGNAEFNLDANAPAATGGSQIGKINGEGSFENNQLYKDKVQRMLNFWLNINDQIVIKYDKQIDNRVFGVVPVGGTPFSRELAIPELEPGLYRFKVLIPQFIPETGLPIVQYVLELVDPTNGIASGVQYVLRYANPEMLGKGELDLLQQYGEAFQARFSAFENTPSLDLWQRSVAYSSLSVNVSIDYEWLKTYNPIIDIPGSPQQKAGAFVYTTPTALDQTSVTTIITNFFADSGDAANPIMQSFKTNQGRGIAGFISQIDLDWRDVLWETDWNPGRDSSRAPKMCSIDMKFLPIHDINPGLDSNGFITAPVYPVGRYSNATHNISNQDRAINDANNTETNLEKDFGNNFTG